MSRAGRREWAGRAISVPEEHSTVTVPRRKAVPLIHAQKGLQRLLACLPQSSASDPANEQMLVSVIPDCTRRLTVID